MIVMAYGVLMFININFRRKQATMSPVIIIFMLCLSHGTCGANQDVSDDMTVVRENYGVTFHKQGILDNAHSVWHQTFVIPLQQSILPESNLYCMGDPSTLDNLTLTLQHFCPAIRAYNKRHSQLKNDVLVAEQNIYQMLEYSKPPRQRRALLGFVGRFAKSLFGVSTEQDTKVLSDQIKQIQEVAKENVEETVTFSHTFRSYIIKANRKLELLEHATKLNNKAVALLTTLWEKSIQSEFRLADLINVLHTYGAQYVDTLVDIRTHLYQTEHALQTLLQGYLPYYFVPPKELDYALDKIATEIAKQGPFKLTHKEIGFYYHLQDIVYKLDKQKLFIKLRIPLTTTTTAFSLYRVHSVPIPLTADQSDRTIIEIQKPYLAISSDKLFYMLLSHSEYQFCTGNHFKRCNQALTMKESSNPSCVLALFYDQPQPISKLCSVTFLPKSSTVESHIITISENSYLVSSQDTQWIQSCPNKAPLQVNPCKLCIVKLPCTCSLKGQTFFIPPTLENCKGILIPTINHSLNLAALFNFYKDNQQLYNLTSKSFFSKPIIPEIPEIKIISEDFGNVVKQERNVKLNLTDCTKY